MDGEKLVVLKNARRCAVNKRIRQTINLFTILNILFVLINYLRH
jgi:hypothetical protein